MCHLLTAYLRLLKLSEGKKFRQNKIESWTELKKSWHVAQKYLQCNVNKKKNTHCENKQLLQISIINYDKLCVYKILY